MKLSLKPAERERALAAGLLETPAPTRQNGPGSTNGPATSIATVPAPAAPQKPATLIEQLRAELGVDFVRTPLALGTAKRVSPAARKLIGKLVKRDVCRRALAAEGSVRFNLDGSVAGPVTEEHRQHARAAVGVPPDEGTTQRETP